MFQILQDDPWLANNAQDIQDRYDRYKIKKKELLNRHGSYAKVGLEHLQNGLIRNTAKGCWTYREWAPNADALFLAGDFNNWNTDQFQLKKEGNGFWSISIPFEEASELRAGSKYKVLVRHNGTDTYKIPAFANYVTQDPKDHSFCSEVFESSFKWSDQNFQLGNEAPLVYESHIGIAQEKEQVGTYKEFEKHILPRVKAAGYNTVQFMAIHEHPYYGSFGYHVSNFFAASSRFGTPDDLKSLVNTAHKMGIAVIMDIVHSHAVKNNAEGLNEFDGSDNQYFHPGERGDHEQWDSKIFNYGKTEVEDFLLSNVRYWLEEFHFDGFRFDGITSMLYFHHGLEPFDNYDKYFKDGVEWDAVSYLQLATELAHYLKPNAILIAEDMSGMPGLCRPIEEGGIGFNFRLGMGIPDYWIKLLKHVPDEQWNMEELYNTLANRRYKENTIAYSESHDQAIVGDKTIAFRLMDQDMYWHMDKCDAHPIVERGIALHKLIRCVTAFGGGEGYLNFIGNEFGHPEWVDFPREGNEWSYQYAKRQWSLVDNDELKYDWLNMFDKALISLISHSACLKSGQELLNIDQINQCIMFQRGDLIIAINFSPDKAIPDYSFVVPEAGNYKIVLDSDQSHFGGHDRIQANQEFFTSEEGGTNKLKIYLPNRTALVFQKS